MFSLNCISSLPKPAISFLLGGISGFSFAFVSLFIDMMFVFDPILDPILIGWYQYSASVPVFCFWFFISYCRSSDVEDLSISRKDAFVVILYGIFEAMAAIFGKLSFRYMRFADANAIFFSSPALIALLSRCFIGTPFGIIEVIVLILSSSGGMLTLQPEFLFGDSVDEVSSNRMKGHVYAVITLLSISMYYIVSQYLKHIRSSLILSLSSIIVVIICSFCVFPMESFRIPETRYELLLLFGICSLTCLKRFMLYRSFLLGHLFATKIGRMLDIPTSYCLQCLIQHKYPSSLSIVGVTLIVISSLIFLMKDFKFRNETRNRDEGKSSYISIEKQDKCDDLK